MECSAVNNKKLKPFPHSQDTYYWSISDALFSDNKNKGLFIIEEVIKGHQGASGVLHWPQSVTQIKAFIHPDMSMINLICHYAGKNVENEKNRMTEGKICCFQLFFLCF